MDELVTRLASLITSNFIIYGSLFADETARFVGSVVVALFCDTCSSLSLFATAWRYCAKYFDTAMKPPLTSA